MPQDKEQHKGNEPIILICRPYATEEASMQSQVENRTFKKNIILGENNTYDSTNISRDQIYYLDYENKFYGRFFLIVNELTFTGVGH